MSQKTEIESLHDLSNPLAIAYGHLLLLIKCLENHEDINHTKVKLHAEKAFAACEKANLIVTERRHSLNCDSP